VQVSYLGYPNTTGVDSIDYRITDAVADPPDSKQAYSERLVRVPHTFLCFEPLRTLMTSTDGGDLAQGLPDVVEPPFLKNGFVTFGSFNTMSKVSPLTLRTWGRILKRVPNSRLVLKSPMFTDETMKQYTSNIVKQLAPDDKLLQVELITKKRLVLLQRTASETEHLECYNLLDIALDTFPYSGTTTTVDALLMGVPVLTRKTSGAKSIHAANVTASILSQAGLAAQLVTESEDDMVERAGALAPPAPAVAGDYSSCQAAADLRSLRAGMRERMLGSPLCDIPGFTRRLEETYRKMWVDFCG